MQQGRGGMSNHKHAISGHPAKNAKSKFMRTLDANQLAGKERRLRPIPKTYATVREAISGESSHR